VCVLLIPIFGENKMNRWEMLPLLITVFLESGEVEVHRVRILELTLRTNSYETNSFSPPYKYLNFDSSQKIILVLQILVFRPCFSFSSLVCFSKKKCTSLICFALQPDHILIAFSRLYTSSTTFPVFKFLPTYSCA
jgi:hypothetical protein